MNTTKFMPQQRSSEDDAAAGATTGYLPQTVWMCHNWTLTTLIVFSSPLLWYKQPLLFLHLYVITFIPKGWVGELDWWDSVWLAESQLPEGEARDCLATRVGGRTLLPAEGHTIEISNWKKIWLLSSPRETNINYPDSVLSVGKVSVKRSSSYLPS